MAVNPAAADEPLEYHRAPTFRARQLGPRAVAAAVVGRATAGAHRETVLGPPRPDPTPAEEEE